MKKFSLPYFGEIDLIALDQSELRRNIDLDGNNIRFDINFENESSDRNKLDTIKDFLDNIKKFDQRNKLYLDKDFTKEGETLDYINFYFDELDKDELSDIINFDNSFIEKERQLLDKLKLVRVGIYPDNIPEYFGVFDYSIDIDGEPCNQLLVVKTDDKGNLDHITWES